MQKKNRLLVHLCCAVDAVYSLDFVKNSFKDYSIKAFFYNPNIVPESEYCLRATEAERVARINNIELIVGEYESELWQSYCRNFYFEPEKGERCSICHKILLNKTAEVAKRENFDYFTTTLFISPKKSHFLIEQAGEEAEQSHQVKFLKCDMRSGNGYLKTRGLVRKYFVYPQHYCGCAPSYTLRNNLSSDTAFSSKLAEYSFVLPASREARNIIYFLRNFLEERAICVDTETSKTFFWDIKRFCVKINGVIIRYPKAVLIGNSCSTNGVFRTRVTRVLENGIVETEKTGVKFYHRDYMGGLMSDTTPKVSFSADVKIGLGDLFEVCAETELINFADSLSLSTKAGDEELIDSCDNISMNIFDYHGFFPRGFTLEMAIEKIECHLQKLKEGNTKLNIFSHVPV